MLSRLRVCILSFSYSSYIIKRNISKLLKRRNVIQIGFNDVKLLRRKITMSQKTLLAYFKTKNQENSKIHERNSSDDSPVKSSKKRARILLEDSDEEIERKPKENKVQDNTEKSEEEKADLCVKRKRDPISPKDLNGKLTESDLGEVENKSPKSEAVGLSAEDEKVMEQLSEGKNKTVSSKHEKSAPKSKKVKKKLKDTDVKEEKKSPTVKGSENTKNEVDVTGDSGKPKKKTSDVDSGVNYNPGRNEYHPVNDAFWNNGEKVPFLALAKTLEEIEDTSSRLKMIQILSNFFRSVIVLSPDDFLHAVYLCLNKLAPDYEGIELGIGEMVLVKALAQATGCSVDKIKADVASKGDLGIVAEGSRSNQRIMFAPPKLTVSSVYHQLKDIAEMSGTSAMNKKIEKIKVMFVACRYSEARYLVRSLSGKLRIGLAEQSVLVAIAQAIVRTPPGQDFPPPVVDTSKTFSAEAFKKKVHEETLILKTTYSECPNYDVIISVLLKEGISALPKHCHVTPGVPMKPMLAHPTKEVIEVLRRFENAKFTCEFKYDGERAQIHILDDGKVNIYSRNQENNTSKYPDIIGRVPKILKPGTKSCILDTEAVGWDRENKQILPFQILSTRKRKDAAESDIKVQVCIFAFDILYLNGESLVRKPFEERRRLLRESFVEIEGEFEFVKSMDGQTIEDIEIFLEESIKGNCEGLMVKTLDVDATYEIAKRSHNWLKVKKDYLEGVGDTLDLVVIGGYHGKGKRTGTYGGFLLACYDDENEEFQTICRIGTGFTESQLDAHTKFFKDHVLSEAKSYFCHDANMKPDEWFDPVQVWEIKCADLSISPVHRAAIGIVDPLKGISLRFPRFLRIRDDKKAEDATTASVVAQLYNNQDQVKNQKGNIKVKSDDESEG